MIKIKIDLRKLSNCKIHQKDMKTYLECTNLFHGKNGAVYLDAVLWDSPNDTYGNDFRVTEDVSKEDRSNGVKGEILGNGKILGQAQSAPPQRQQQRARQAPINEADDLDSDSIPF